MHPKYPVKRILMKRDARADCWVAQCVDFDLVAQAKTLEDLPKALGHVYWGEVILALENGEDVRFNPAPEEAIIEWANITERTTAKKSLPWKDFTPTWLPGALGRLAKKFLSAARKDVEVAEMAPS